MVNQVSVARAMRDVAAGARVLAAPGCGTPETLLRELGRHTERTDGIALTTGLTLGSFPFAEAVREKRLRYRTWHPYGAGRDLVRDGLAEYLPLRASDVRVTITGNVDVLLLRVSPPGRDGWCCTGPTASFTRAACETAKLVIAEVDPGLPRTSGDSRVHLSEITSLVDSDDETPCYPEPDAPDSRAEAIAAHVAGLIPDRAIVSLGHSVAGHSVAGNSAVTEAVGELLGRRDGPFGVRVVGVVTERMTALADASSGTARAVELLGGPGLMAWANRNSRVEMTSSDRVHDPVFLSQAGPFVSVEPAVSVDLTGQVVSDAIGAVDLFEGAHLSGGGLRIVALTSAAADGRPAIVAEHPAGTPVTIGRHSVDVVVTEHGAAWLRGRTIGERREALLAIAGPIAGSEEGAS